MAAAVVRFSIAAAKCIPMSSAADGDRSDDAKEPIRSINLSEQDIRAAARLLSALSGPEDDRGRELTVLANSNEEMRGRQERAVLQERARRTYVGRARRSQIFNKQMFGEAAWDMLLALYATDQSGALHTVSGLVNLAGVPPTSALRWLKFLEQEELVSRHPSALDGRVFRIKLTDKARELLDAYFAATDSDES